MKNKEKPFDHLRSPVGPHVTGILLEKELEELEWEKQELERRKKEGKYKKHRRKLRKRKESDNFWEFGGH